jgi:hypothetical protein
MPREHGSGAANESAAQALERARTHAQRALSEALASVRALLDAASIGWSGKPSEAHAALRGIAELLDEQAARIQTGQAGVPAPVMNAVLEALDHEIERWEKRASTDSEARSVLRTFLGLREILWEFGLRRETTAEPEKPTQRTRTASRQTARKAAQKRPAARATRRTPVPDGDTTPKSPPAGRVRRVQRVEVKGS